MKKNASYYIDLILMNNHSMGEWRTIYKEVEEWFENASESQKREFEMSGAGEMLYMICT